MLYFYGAELLDRLGAHYGARLRRAKEQGFDRDRSEYHWLWRELDLRVRMIRQTRVFLDALPGFLVRCTGEEAMRYTADFTSSWFTEEYVGILPEDDEGRCPYLSDSSPYWTAVCEAMDELDAGAGRSPLPMFCVELGELAARSLRLCFFLREKQFRPIDGDRFGSLTAPDEELGSSA